MKEPIYGTNGLLYIVALSTSYNHLKTVKRLSLLSFYNGMNLEPYSYATNNTYLDYEFESIGPNGVVKKVARFSEIGDGIFNLGFGDLDEKTGNISDSVATNNADTEKVLATVALIAYRFTEVYQGALIFIKGTTKARTRLYQINIARYWDEISNLFELQGLLNSQWEPFRKNVNYEAFIAWRRIAPF